MVKALVQPPNKRLAAAIVFQTIGASTYKMADLKAGDAFQDFVGPLGNPSDFVKEDMATQRVPMAESTCARR